MPPGVPLPHVINPIDRDRIAGPAALQHECEIRVFGNSRAHITGGDDLAVMPYRQYLDEMRRYRLIGGGILIPAMFHRMGYQGAYLGVAAYALCADFNRHHGINLRSRRWSP